MAYGITDPARRRGIFGKPVPNYNTPGIGDSLPQNQPPPMAGSIPDMTEQREPGLGTRLFGSGWEDKAFALGGIMQGDPSGVYMMRQEKQREQQARSEAAAAELKRAQEMADWRWKEDYKAEKDRPAIAQNYEFIRETAGQEAADRYVNEYGARPEEPRMVSIPGRGSFFGTMDEVQAWLRGNGPSNVPSKPVGGLTPMGGASSNASGGF